MCGITGLYTFQPRIDRLQLHEIVQRMTDAIISRGPDAGDVWQDPDAPLALGHRRLSIIDLSPMGAQPMESHSGRYMIAYNGEIYNFKDIRKELQNAHDVEFRGGSDTEVLLSAIDNWGVSKTLQKISGMFAFALWDRKTKALYFARDRFGKKPLYIGWAGSTLVFGSELKSICAHPDFCRDVDRGSLTSYMRFGYVPAPMSIYKRVYHLPAGMMMALDMSMLSAGQDLTPMMEHYWNPKDVIVSARENTVSDDEDTIIRDFENLLQSSVSSRMVSDVPIGAFLSGGIDSSTVVSLMQKHANENGGAKVKTYSIGFDEPGYNEAEHAKEIAAHLGTDHHEKYVSAKDALGIVPQLPKMFDEPFSDTSAIPTHMVSKFARENVTVALSGDGGDEMLGGYNRHISGPKAWKTINNIPANLRGPFSKVIGAIPVSIWDKMRPGRPQFGTHMHKFSNLMSKQSENDIYLSLVSSWQKPKDLVSRGYENQIPLVDPEMQIEGLSFAERMMYWDAISYMNGDILTKVDRASMSVGLEARAPLLDQRIYEYVWRLPIDMKIRQKRGKYLLRCVLENHVPRELFDRPKQGFSVPIAQWLRTDLRDWAEDLLDEKTLREQGHLDYKLVRKTWERHLKGRGADASKLWTVIMFQAWKKQWDAK